MAVDSQDGVRHPDKGTDKTILLISRHYWRSPDGLAALAGQSATADGRRSRWTKLVGSGAARCVRLSARGSGRPRRASYARTDRSFTVAATAYRSSDSLAAAAAEAAI